MSHLLIIPRTNRGYFLVDTILKYEHFQIYSSNYLNYCSLGVFQLLSFYFAPLHYHAALRGFIIERIFGHDAEYSYYVTGLN
jgi:hypothetical protein